MITDYHNLDSPTKRILSLKNKTLSSVRYLSIEQAKIITRTYQQNEDQHVNIIRALSLSNSLAEMPIAIDPEELIVGNRTPDIRAGVVFPEAGINWLLKEIDTLPDRPQDPFRVREEDKKYFIEIIEPYWRGKTMEDDIYNYFGEEISSIEKVVKINQKDHAQGHICPSVEDWLKLGPAGILVNARQKLEVASAKQRPFYEGVCITLDAACNFIYRYSMIASRMCKKIEDKTLKANLQELSSICKNLSERPPETFREALQSTWFLFVILQMESNASSFSPGRMDQYLYPYYRKDISTGRINLSSAIELLDALFIKFNQIVYMRNAQSARYFAGFPIGFNITVGGQTKDGK